MDENGRIEKRILKHLFREKRASKKILLTAVRRDGASRTTMQEINMRVEYLLNQGVIMHHTTFGRSEIYILSEEKRDELDDES